VAQPTTSAKLMLLAGCIAGSIGLPGPISESTAAATTVSTAPPSSGELHEADVSPAVATALAPLQLAANWRVRQGLYYKRNWGVEVIGVHPVSSGYMLAFRYRVLDTKKAKPVNDMKGKAYLIDEATHTRLAVPALENVGELRTGAAPETDRTYFMIFGNPGRLVKAGSRVSVVIGDFHAEDMIVN
jgi:hypothetical protein